MTSATDDPASLGKRQYAEIIASFESAGFEPHKTRAGWNLYVVPLDRREDIPEIETGFYEDCVVYVYTTAGLHDTHDGVFIPTNRMVVSVATYDAILKRAAVRSE